MAGQPNVRSIVLSGGTLNVADHFAAATPAFRWLAVVALTSAIVAVSIVPGEPQPGDGIFIWVIAKTPTLLQKSIHVVIYGLQTALLFWSFRGLKFSKAYAAVLAATIAIALGALLEWMQLSVPGRFGSLYDVGLNSAGTAGGLLVLFVSKAGWREQP